LTFRAEEALAVWLVLIAAEVLHGIARGAFLVPYVGESGSNQIGVFTGSVIILAIALATVRWIGATRPAQLLLVGLVWLVLTVAFEVLFGRFVAGLTWERLAADYNVLEGGLMPLGLAEERDYLPISNASTESPVFSTRLGLSTGLNAGLCVRRDPFGK